MSLELWTLAGISGPLFTALFTQAAIITSGFVGLSLGATPTAVANMDAPCSKFGPSSTAFLVIPLVGAFFIDLINAFVVSTMYNFFGS